MTYQDKILKEVQQVTNMPYLTKQDLFAVIVNLIKSGELKTKLPTTYISKHNFEALWRFLLDGDSFNNGISIFKDEYNKWKYYQYKHSNKYKDDIKSESNDIDKNINYNPEEDMNYVSNQLLQDDDIYYTNENKISYMKNKNTLYNSLITNISKSLKEELNIDDNVFTFSEYFLILLYEACKHNYNITKDPTGFIYPMDGSSGTCYRYYAKQRTYDYAIGLKLVKVYEKIAKKLQAEKYITKFSISCDEHHFPSIHVYMRNENFEKLSLFIGGSIAGAYRDLKGTIWMGNFRNEGDDKLRRKYNLWLQGGNKIKFVFK